MIKDLDFSGSLDDFYMVYPLVNQRALEPSDQADLAEQKPPGSGVKDESTNERIAKSEIVKENHRG